MVIIWEDLQRLAVIVGYVGVIPTSSWFIGVVGVNYEGRVLLMIVILLWMLGHCRLGRQLVHWMIGVVIIRVFASNYLYVFMVMRLILKDKYAN